MIVKKMDPVIVLLDNYFHCNWAQCTTSPNLPYECGQDRVVVCVLWSNISSDSWLLFIVILKSI